jgi:uncharacterized protein YbbC (DUF1343 family)
VYDLQEVGGRTWTYVSTMALSMQAAKKKGIPFVVLDRPNPIGGEIVEGALVEPKFKSFVGFYPGTVYFEGTNLTEGRGTDRPFEQIGAPWLNAKEVVRVMNDHKLPGIQFEAITLSVEPTAAKYGGLTIPGIRFVITDRQSYRPVRTALILIDEIRRQHPTDFMWRQSIDRLTGSDKVRLAIESGQLPSLLAQWDREAAEFKTGSKQFLLY